MHIIDIIYTFIHVNIKITEMLAVKIYCNIIIKIFNDTMK